MVYNIGRQCKMLVEEAKGPTLSMERHGRLAGPKNKVLN